MEDEIVEILVEVGGGILVAGVSLAALAAAVAAAQWFFYKFSDQIFDYLRGRLKDYPTVKKVVMAVLQVNHNIVTYYINGTKYVAVHYLGLPAADTDTKNAEEIRTSTTTIMTKEELEKQGMMEGLRTNSLTDEQKGRLKGFTEEELLELGLIPEQVAIGKKMMDGEGKVLRAAVIADESKVLELRN